MIKARTSRRGGGSGQELYRTFTASITTLDLRAYSLGMQRPGRDHILPPSAKVKSEWGYMSTLPYVFLACTGNLLFLSLFVLGSQRCLSCVIKSTKHHDITHGPLSSRLLHVSYRVALIEVVLPSATL